MISNNLLSDLEEIVDKGLEDASIPYAKGNSIRIKQYIIRKSKVGYLVYDSSTNKQVHMTQFKSVAIAIAKNLAERRNRIDKILEIEGNLAKHYNDAVFYKNMISGLIFPIQIFLLNFLLKGKHSFAQLQNTIELIGGKILKFFDNNGHT